jgi:excisionase family DNA binding protein
VKKTPKNPPAEAANFGSLARFLKKHEAAGYLQVTPRYIERMVRLGRLRAFRPTGKLCRFRASDLDFFMESGASIKEGN